MRDALLWLVQALLIIQAISGVVAIWSHWKKNHKLERWVLTLLTIAGPATLALCWQTQLLFRDQEAIFWGRLMAGNEAWIFRLGSLGLIASSGLALGALSLSKHAFKRPLITGAVFVALSWYILYLHPTPHYVPVPSWIDKLTWFVVLVGGACFCILIYARLRDYLQLLCTPVTIVSGLVSVMSVLSIYSFYEAKQPVDLEPLQPRDRLLALGCFSCHSMGDYGYPDPGGGLESVASRTEDVVLAFMAEPTAEKAQELGIRENPSGLMAGVQLSEEEAKLTTEALKSLFEIQPPSMLGPGTEQVEAILMDPAHTCLACHSIRGEGAPNGGVGGPLEESHRLGKDALVKWLQEPSYLNALELKIREEPQGAMTPFTLDEQEAEIIADWLMSLGEQS
jgi:hypothetical protein